jgi:hypothetical protein
MPDGWRLGIDLYGQFRIHLVCRPGKALVHAAWRSDRLCVAVSFRSDGDIPFSGLA